MIPSESLAQIIQSAMGKAVDEATDVMAGNAITIGLLVRQLDAAGVCNVDRLLADLSEAAQQAQKVTTRICLRHTIAVVQTMQDPTSAP